MKMPSPFRLLTVHGSRPRPGVDLDCPRTLDVEDDVERFVSERRLEHLSRDKLIEES